MAIDQQQDTSTPAPSPEERRRPRRLGERRRGAWPAEPWQRWALACALAAFAGLTHAFATGTHVPGYWAGVASSAALTLVAGVMALVQYLRR